MTEENIPIFRATTEPTESFIPRVVDDDDRTVTTGENPNSNGPKTSEICVRWEFPTNTDKKSMMKNHLDILKAMKKAYPNITIIDNNREEHNTTKTLNLSNKGAKFEFWTSKNRTATNQRVICQHRIRTDVTLSTLKTTWEVMDKLRNAKAYVGLHDLGEKVKEVAHLGFLLKTHVVHVPKTIAIQRLRQRLKQAHGDVPRFTLAAQTITASPSQELKHRAKAYDIRCDQKDASKLSKMLQSEPFAQDPVYMPYHMKRMNPNAFSNALRVQNEIHCNAYVIKAQGVTNTMMTELWNMIAQEPGMMEIVPTQNLSSQGEWRILVHKDQFNEIHSKISGHFDQWWQSLDEATQNDYPFPEPKIVSRKNNVQYECDDESLNTYASMLTNMYDPPTEEDNQANNNRERNNTPPPQAPRPNRTPTSPGASKVSGSSRVSGLTQATGTNSTHNATLEAKVEILQTTVNDLTAQIAQLLAIISENHPPESSKRRALQTTPQKVRESKKLFETSSDHSDHETMQDEETPKDQEMIVFSQINTQPWEYDDTSH